MEKKITTPLTREKVKELKAGDTVLITGTIYTARDAAHKRLVELIDQGKELPMDVIDSIIYYVGPTPAKPGQAIGSAGPTTSYRMDPYSPKLIELGLRGMIGKGLRGPEVIEAIKKNTGVYFGAIGGAAALIGKSVTKAEIIAYEDLGAEAIRRLEVVDFPVVVVIDSEGNNLYEIGQKNYLDSIKK
jgi:fumarate hydratase subunit beta